MILAGPTESRKGGYGLSSVLRPAVDRAEGQEGSEALSSSLAHGARSRKAQETVGIGAAERNKVTSWLTHAHTTNSIIRFCCVGITADVKYRSISVFLVILNI